MQATRLAAALARCTPRREHGVFPQPGAERKLFIRDGERCWFVALHEVRLFASEGNYTRVHFQAHQPLILRSLKQLEERLDPERYFRASRRHIVNLDHVTRATPNEAGGFDLLLRGGEMVEVARRRAARFRQIACL